MILCSLINIIAKNFNYPYRVVETVRVDVVTLETVLLATGALETLVVVLVITLEAGAKGLVVETLDAGFLAIGAGFGAAGFSSLTAPGTGRLIALADGTDFGRGAAETGAAVVF